MSLTTRCPSCGTMFKVVPDQLRISDGWVRCGQCADIFDASQHLQAPGALAAAEAPAQEQPSFSPPLAPPPPPPSSPAVWQHRSVAARTVLHAQEEPEPLLEEDREDEPFGPYTAPGLDRLEFPPAPASGMPADTPAVPTLTTEDVPSALLLQTADSDEPQDLLYQPAFAAPAPPPGGSAEAGIEAEADRRAGVAPGEAGTDIHWEPVQGGGFVRERRSPRRQALIAAERQGPPSLSPPDSVLPQQDAAPSSHPAEPGTHVHATALQDLGFVRAAERRAFWRRPLVVAASLAGCLLLVAGLLLQAAVFQRDLLVAHLPGLRPSIEALCAPLHCQIAPLRRIESWVVDGSAFNKARGDYYQFNVDLRSTAGVPLAMPSVELTLTDTDDKPLLRRVLAPAELHAPQVLAARGAWSGTLPMKVQAPADPARVAGYRVLVFYP